MPRSALASLSLSLCGLSVGVAALPAQEDAVRRTYDLGSLAVRPPGIVRLFEELESAELILPVGPILPSSYIESDFRLDSGAHITAPAHVPYLSTDLVIPWLDPIWAEEGTGILADGRLYLTASPAVHERVRKELMMLEGLLMASATVTLHVLPDAAGTAHDGRAVLTPPQVEALLAAHTPLRSHTTTPTLDVPEFVENGRARRYVRDHDVEVAQKAAINDPKVDLFFDGDRVGFDVTPMADGRLLVRMGVSRSASQDLVRRMMTTPLGGGIQLPRVEFSRAQAAMAVPNGGGFLLGSKSRGEGVWLVVVEADELQGVDSPAVPLGHAILPPLRPESAPDVIVHPGEDAVFDSSDSEGDPSLADLLEVHVDEAMDDATLDVQQVGTHALFRGDQGLRRLLRERLAADAAAMKTWAVHWRFGEVNRGAARGSAAEVAAALAGGAQGVIPTASRHGFTATAGEERAIVRDFEVEIASKSEAMNPVVDSVYSGWFFSGAIRPSPSGRPILEYDFIWADSTSGQLLELEGKGSGTIDRPDTHVLKSASRAPCKAGAWRVLFRRADPRSKDKDLVLVVRVDEN